MFKRIACCVIVVASAFSAATASAEGTLRLSGQTALLQAPLQPAPPSSPAKAPIPADEEAKKRSLISDIAVIATVIAASRAAYLAMGKPCGCPDHVAANGSRCGLRSAHSKPGGFKPLCFPTDISPAIIATWRATGGIPSL